MPEAQSLTFEQRSQFSGPVLMKFMEVCGHWQLDETEELSFAGYPDPKNYMIWCIQAISGEPVCLEEGRLLRLGAVVGVHDATSRLLPSYSDHMHWLRNPSRGPICRGLSPYEILSDPEEIRVLKFRKKVDEWLESQFLKGAKIRRLI